MVVLTETLTEALLNAASTRHDAPSPVKRFAKRAVVALQVHQVLPSAKDIVPGRKVAHGGGVSSATLRMSHNTPSSTRR